MAKIISVSNGKNKFDCLLSGTLGDKVYCVRNGIQYTRSRPSRVPKPKTAAQLNQSAKFSTILKFLQPLTGFLRVGFKNEHATMSSFNAAMSYNFKNALCGTYPDYEVDYSKVRVSQGKLPGALNPIVRLTTTGEIEFTWENNSFEIDSMADDKALLVLYNSTKQEAIFTVDGKPRYSGRQVITLPTTFADDEVQCYIAFQNQKQTNSSNSQFVSKIGIKQVDPVTYREN